MLDFRRPTLEDAQWARAVLQTMQSGGPAPSEMGFGTLYLWSSTYDTQICRYRNSLIIRYSDEETYAYDVPVGDGDLHEMIEATIADAQAHGKKYRLWGITDAEMPLVEASEPGRFFYYPERDHFDYVYRTEDLAELKGRKYHSKRNHLARFRKMYPSYTFELLHAGNLADCLPVARQWCCENGCGEELRMENCAIAKALREFDALHLEGGLIRIDGAPVSFVIGEALNPDTIDLHFEKALSGYEGLYAAINQEFAANLLGKYQYINREEDMGSEGLRKAKLSYYPAVLLEKHAAVLKEEAADAAG
ncbi:DUF2156 domain-containing protein [Yeguia hominis]|uniref:DUF2156 domain-containing protein n=1 Tax=Yeguia hominis TaxID=2763662 RepID=A0A926HSL9_9FIRM|nr:phosphatidylglycerol lysyltransferase domain-containing protein [Yeguia hominis]MBC8534423.1 DUF2156 domain-containing protein [Yeguia hominis]